MLNTMRLEHIYIIVLYKTTSFVCGIERLNLEGALQVQFLEMLKELIKQSMHYLNEFSNEDCLLLNDGILYCVLLENTEHELFSTVKHMFLLMNRNFFIDKSLLIILLFLLLLRLFGLQRQRVVLLFLPFVGR